MTTPSLRPPAVIAVLGAGNMGSGIAQACAQAGFVVRVRDVDEPTVHKGRERIEKMLAGAIERQKMSPARRDEVLGRVTFTTDLTAAVAGAALVVEAVFEEVAVKRAVFAEIAPQVSAETIVATNTSSLSVAELSEGSPIRGGSRVSTSSIRRRSTSSSRSSGDPRAIERRSGSSSGSATCCARSRSRPRTRPASA